MSIEHILPIRYLSVARSVEAGRTSIADRNFRNLVDSQLERRECGSYNPPVENVLDELGGVIRETDTISNLKRDLGITRADIMIYYASFADSNRLSEVEKLCNFAPESIATIRAIEQESDRIGGPVGVGSQLGLALDNSSRDITRAVLSLSIGTRAIARKQDSRILLGETLSDDRVFAWKRRVKAFGVGEGPEDTAGDTYHFWHGVLTGISREERTDFFATRSLKRMACDLIYPNTAQAVQLLRHKMYLGMDTWNTHETVDRLGYSIGRAFMGMYSGNREGVK